MHFPQDLLDGNYMLTLQMCLGNVSWIDPSGEKKMLCLQKKLICPNVMATDQLRKTDYPIYIYFLIILCIKFLGKTITKRIDWWGQ